MINKTLQCIYDIYKYNLIKEVVSYVNYKKRLIENKPDFVVEWNDSEFKANTSHPQINQDNPYSEKTHKLNYRISEMFKTTIPEKSFTKTINNRDGTVTLSPIDPNWGKIIIAQEDVDWCGECGRKTYLD